MTSQDYTSLLDYLFTELNKLQSNEIVEEINSQINRGKTLTIKDATDLKRMNIKQSEVGKTQTLPLTSKEAFEVAIDYLSKIIIDVPNYAKSIGHAFGENVSWQYDESQSMKSFNISSTFSLNEIIFDEQELNKASEEIQRIKNLIKDHGNIF